MARHIQELKDNIENLYGKDQLELLLPSLESTIDRWNYVRYHFNEYKGLLTEFLAEKPDGKSLIMLTLGADEEERNSFLFCRMKAEANIIACLQSMHAASDILGHVIYFSLNMNNSPSDQLKPRDVTIYRVAEKLNGHDEYVALHNYVNGLILHSDYIYMKDIVNLSKHRSIVGMPFKLDVQKNYADWEHGIEFHTFEYDGRRHSERWVDDFLNAEYSRQDRLLVEIGTELNRIVQEKTSGRTGS